MSAAYGNYARNITRISPFVWAHRLEIPLALGIAAIIVSLIAGFATGSALLDRVMSPSSLTSEALIRACFFIFTFFCGLATLFWLVLLSRTLDLRYSLKASKYPIYAVVVIGAVIINASPFVFSNVAEMYASNKSSLRLFTPSLGNEAWGTSGLMFYLAFISIAVLLGLLIRRCSFHVPFSSFFICVSFLLSSLLYALVVATESEAGRSFIILYIIACAVAVACGFATYLGKLQKYQEVILGIILFAFSPASIYLLYAVSAEINLFPILGAEAPGASFARNTSFWGVILLFCVGLGLNELTFSIIRKARSYAS